MFAHPASGFAPRRHACAYIDVDIDARACTTRSTAPSNIWNGSWTIDGSRVGGEGRAISFRAEVARPGLSTDRNISIDSIL
jgi:hypothetical protein